MFAGNEKGVDVNELAKFGEKIMADLNKKKKAGTLTEAEKQVYNELLRVYNEA